MKQAKRTHIHRAAWLLLAGTGLILPAATAGAQSISCDPPAVAALDAEGNPYCAEPNVSCYEDYPPTYGGNGYWICPAIEEVKALKRLKEGPKISCSMGAVFWNEQAGDWACEELTECQICKRCFEYVVVAKEKCVDKSREVARRKCDGAYGSTWKGERVDASGRTCERKSFQDEATGKTRHIDLNCTGPAIDECISGWEVSHPGESSGTSSSGSVSYKVGAKGGGKIFGIGVEVSGERGTTDTEGQSYSASWGGGKGYLAACDEGADKVAAQCGDCSAVCEED